MSDPEANGALVADAFVTYYVEADKNYLVLNEDGDTFEAVIEDDIRVNSNTAYIDCSKLAKAEEVENGLVFAVSGAKPFAPTVKGDVNGDGKVNGADIQEVINVIVDGVFDKKADINEDGKVNGADIQEIINIIVG